MFSETLSFIQQLYPNQDFIALHEPKFFGNEKKYLNECIDSTYVSSIGKFVNKFEDMLAQYTKSKYAIATVNGTSALHIALKLVGTDKESEVITQALSFVATCNAINYCNASPIFLDVDRDSLGLSPKNLLHFLQENTIIKNDICYSKISGKKITAVIPMHTFGHPCAIEEIAKICEEFHIALVEDAAEGLGSFYNNKHLGTFGKLGILSFNGNKTITSGNGGMILTDDETLAKRAKHLTTTAKLVHPYHYEHDEIGYNYRLSNINAALGCAQMENLEKILENKRDLASLYADFFNSQNIKFIHEAKNAHSNYWLNTIELKDELQRDEFLHVSNQANIMTRPIWKLLNTLEMFQNAYCDDLSNSKYFEKRLVNIPSGMR